MSDRPPAATDDELVAAAEALMRAHGTTTTLDVKEHLREAGFWAVQDEVSTRMRDLAPARRWRVRATGAHRVYALDDDRDDDPEDDLDERLLRLLGGSTVH